MAPFSVKILVVGSLETNCYVVWDRMSMDALIIDPGDDAEYVSDTVGRLGVMPRMIVATHGHFDHILSAFALQSMYNIPCAMHEGDAFLVANMKKSATHFLHLSQVDPPPVSPVPVVDGSELTVGGSRFSVISTPGHTPGSICLYQKQHRVLFTGDTLFADGAVGRTDRSYGDRTALDRSLSILFKLPDTTIVFPGHGKQTSIGAERRNHGV